MIYNIVCSLSLFLMLSTNSHYVNAFVDTLALGRMIHTPISYSHGKTAMWSVLEDKTTSTPVTTEVESLSEETETSHASLESTSVDNSNDDVNKDTDINSKVNDATITETVPDDDLEKDDLMKQIKESGVAGVISYASWELAFWTVSVPVCVLGYKEVTGHWPDLNNKDDISKLGAEAFAFVNFARFAVPLRIGLALSTTPWIQENIVDLYLVDKEKNFEKDVEKKAEKKKENDSPDETLVVESVEDSEEGREKEEDPDEIAVVQSITVDDEEKNSTPKGSRSRFRSRLKNFISRVLRRNN